MNIEGVISRILEVEGSTFTHHPSDSGGPTKWGITQQTLAQHRNRPVTVEEVAALTEAEARVIYRIKYVIRPRFNRVGELSEAIAVELIDTGVNSGPSVATIFLQRCLNALNQLGARYADIAVDGDCGPKTLGALTKYLEWRGPEGEQVLLSALNCLQGERYIALAEGRPKDETFLYGWLKERVAVAP